MAALTSASVSPFERWQQHFIENRDRARHLPWDDPYRLTVDERRLVGPSIQQFQLGEWARGRGFRRRASSDPVLAVDPSFLPTLELFIAEEQGHSAILGRFLDRERIPRLASEWTDQIFRRLRKLAGLELCVMVLVTAEGLALPFYRALRDSTRSGLLRAICVRILCDEAAHLHYQALTLGLICQRRRGRPLFHSTLFHVTALLLWQQHWRVFRTAGSDFRRFRTEARREFTRLQQKIQQVSSGRGPYDDLRLD